MDGIKVVVDDSLVTHVDVDLDMLGRGAVESLQRQYARQPDLFQKKMSEAESERPTGLSAFNTARPRISFPEGVFDRHSVPCPIASAA